VVLHSTQAFCKYIPVLLNRPAEHPGQAMSNNVPICSRRGLHSLRLLPYYPALQAHLDALETMPAPMFSKPPHLGSLQEGQDALEDACELKYGLPNNRPPGGWDGDWRGKVRLGYERLAQTLWKVAREFDVRGYGMVLREKLTTKWCDCGCSTDHLGEVCERTVREEEEESGVRSGKQREWDGRGSGVYGWETEEEEDIWEVDLDFGGLDPDEPDGGMESEMTIGEIMEWRYFKAEREKEEVSYVLSLCWCTHSTRSHVRETLLFARVITPWPSNITRSHMRWSLSYHTTSLISPPPT
jgi:hypothetical protein